MIFFLISCLYFLLLSKFLSLQPLPLTEERSLCVWFWRELTGLFLQWLKDYGLSNFIFRMSLKKKCVPKVENVGEVELSLLDLPELTLECILGRLSPAGLSNMAEVCSSLRDRCRSDHLWERHMKEKWSRLIGQAAYKEWQWFIASRNNSGATDGAKLTSWLGTILCIWPVSWFRSLIDGGGKLKSPLPVESIMCLYLSLEGGKFWFPAQVYNREHGHVGFMLSCYDAELSYDCYTDTFHARYPPHGRRTIVIEEGVQWERLRAPPVDTPPHDLHVSDCLNDLRPGDHIEIQWRRSKEFPYGWWYGVVGHLESCDRNERYCRCHNSDTVILEFNQYMPDSRWRRTTVNRKDHREEGIEEDGFYGGIRKLYCKEEIAKWEGLRPTDVLE